MVAVRSSETSTNFTEQQGVTSQNIVLNNHSCQNLKSNQEKFLPLLATEPEFPQSSNEKPRHRTDWAILPHYGERLLKPVRPTVRL
jgi:hypothetical protein